MKAYIIMDGYNYDPEAKTGWNLYNGSVEDCIKEYAGHKAINLIWEDETGSYSVVIPSYNDTKLISRLIAVEVVNDIKAQFKK